MRFRYLAVVAVLAFAGLLAPPAQAQEKATLRLNLKQGQTYSLTTSSQQRITQTFGGNTATVNQTFGFTYSFAATKVDADGTVHGTYTYDAVRFKSDAPGAIVDYDSTKADGAEGANPMAKAFAALVGQKLEVVLTQDGKLKELKGADRLLAAVIKAMNVPGGNAAMLEQQMKAQFGEEALKANFEQMTAIYPEKPVAVGDSWDIEQKFTAGMSMTQNTTYTLKSLSGGKATLEVKGTLKSDPDAPAEIVPGAKFALEGPQSGLVVLDQATGWVTSGSLKQTMEGKVSIDAGGQQVEIPMKVESDTTISQAKPAAPKEAK